MRGRQLHVEDPLLGGDERLELSRDLPDLSGTTLLEEEEQEVTDERVGALEDLPDDGGLHGRIGLAVGEQRVELGDLVERPDHLLELGANGIEAAFLLRGLEERAGIDAFRDGYERLASSCEKSISASASSTSRF